MELLKTLQRYDFKNFIFKCIKTGVIYYKIHEFEGLK